MRMHAGVMPTVGVSLVRAMGRYGLDMTDVPGGPRSIEVGSAGDLAVARVFADRARAASPS